MSVTVHGALHLAARHPAGKIAVSYREIRLTIDTSCDMIKKRDSIYDLGMIAGR